MLTDYHVLHETDPDSRDTKYGMIYTKSSIYEIRSVKAPYIYIEIRCGYTSVLHSVNTSDLHPYRSQTIDMSGECMNVTIQ